MLAHFQSHQFFAHLVVTVDSRLDLAVDNQRCKLGFQLANRRIERLGHLVHVDRQEWAEVLHQSFSSDCLVNALDVVVQIHVE